MYELATKSHLQNNATILSSLLQFTLDLGFSLRIGGVGEDVNVGDDDGILTNITKSDFWFWICVLGSLGVVGGGGGGGGGGGDENKGILLIRFDSME
ncbi:hypothetical protein HYALB_00007753 [Hymenoscyphus albidus]|uniref:Uncharacterized protein n=1 Tax=Hymenoscyphus albidus TaxID=595503 RepID=A0A9N9LTT5_9HELO|nr:hypothetical protein HYALB_00007753 [Hymenoscyphus albidus]